MNRALKEFVEENYTLVQSVETQWNGTVKIYKANCMKDIPLDLIGYITGCFNGYWGLYGIGRLFFHNCDWGTFDATFTIERKSKNLFNVYINAILRRPFTEEQRKKYERFCFDGCRIKRIYDSVND